MEIGSGLDAIEVADTVIVPGFVATLRLHLARDASITPTAYRNAFRGDAKPERTAH